MEERRRGLGGLLDDGDLGHLDSWDGELEVAVGVGEGDFLAGGG